ncbi:conserved protein of unknown function [Tepidanaerobacter acetatoxydans Re1]|uniref:PHP domain protein n=1 Tax=Tepidanaerobacter acetatoxydans (strain DSM 21804 / JCM 16047 / Re1) TaxID=1209989 RepID=F4LSJ8_TEPAE|nr:DUF6282 family protein [Tepidanaerobacter acetatoxydans]AEE92388.1 hypothetical protein TepRe1_2269 [Tepidanaerobacter acetatoxydans Re1]CDI40995.1 conserved protein of unknown function [Tepidanaerobacter acetatoxydans Re1]
MARTRISIKGACDLHIHTSPDIFDRLANDVETATICRDAGMRAIVFKCHADTTMVRAYHTQNQVEGIKVFGGVVLNHQSGGINPAAVDVALKLGAVQVWMPSYHSLAHYNETGKLGAYGHQGDGVTNYPIKGITVLDENGKLIPQVYTILEMVKKYNAIIGTSHLSAKEALMVIAAAREIGCQKVVLTHPFFAPPSCTVEQVKKAVDMGAYVEFCAGNALSPIPKPIPISLYKETIDIVGSKNLIISSDTGQPRKTLAPETMRMFAQTLNYMGVPEKDLSAMLCYNYNNLLDLD